MKKIKLRKKEQGITLIALVVTIVVLLILAGTSIAMLTGENGIIKQAQAAKKQNEIGEEKEYITLAYSAVKSDKMKKGDTSAVTSEELQAEMNKMTDNATVTGEGTLNVKYDSGRSYEVDENGNITISRPRPVISNIKITTDGKTVPEEKSLNLEETVQIEFDVTMPGGKVVSINPKLPKTTDGNNPNVEFTITVEVKGEEYSVTETISVSKYYKINHSEEIADPTTPTGIYANNPNIKEVRKGCKGNIPIPKGFNYVQGCDMGGAVISDGNSEFVWVPVNKENLILDLSSTYATLDDAGVRAEVQKQTDQKKYPMAIKINSTDYIGVLYDFSNYNSTDKTTTIKPFNSWTPKSKSNCREPDILSTSYDSDTNLAVINEILGTKYTQANWKDNLQKEYNEIVNQVKKYGGFYYGRYETSLDSNKKAQTKKGETSITGATKTESGKSYWWYGLYAQAHNYNNTANSIKSTMISGSQYDQMLIWMTSNGINVTAYPGSTILDITGEGTERNTSRTTGIASKDRLCNIFDIFGNSREWTSEATNTYYRLGRGGYCDYNYSAYYRGYSSSTDGYGYYSSRPTLIIK